MELAVAMEERGVEAEARMIRALIANAEGAIVEALGPEEGEPQWQHQQDQLPVLSADVAAQARLPHQQRLCG